MQRSVTIALLTVTLLSAAGTVQAEARYNPLKMTCEAVKDVIRQQGAVTLRYTSTRVKNLPLYNRYVRNSSFCARDEVAVPALVPTQDRERCGVNICEHREFEQRRIPWLLND